MCMITAIPANVEIPVEGLKNGGRSNNDGHGFAIASASLRIIETFGSMKLEETLDVLHSKRKEHGKNSVILFHSRFGTHGEYGEFNIHPFWVGDEPTVMAHNGILPVYYHPDKGDRRSDTRIFVDRVAPHYVKTPTGVPSRRMSKRLGDMIGSGNKLTFLSIKSGVPAMRIVNSRLGVQREGVWYSNHGFEKSTWGNYGGGLWSGYSDWDDEVWDSVKKAWVPRDEKTPRKGGILTEREAEECPMCGGETDYVAAVCIECDFCLDCQSYSDECMCYQPRYKSVDEDAEYAAWAAKAQDQTILGIEDAGDDGWVKVNGCWVNSRGLVESDSIAGHVAAEGAKV